MKAKAIVFRKANHPTLEDISLPELGKGEALVKIHYSGVSIGTESSLFTGARTHNGTFPMVTGYMASGVVEKVADDVTTFKPGDNVINMGTRFAGEINSIWGGHCSYHIASANSLIRVPNGADMRDASFFVLPCVGLNAVGMANITENDTVLIVGQGLIGQFCGQWAAARGARVIAVEPDSIRKALSMAYVTKDVIDPGTCDVEKEVERLTNGQWPTVVVEATANKNLIGNTSCFIRRMHARMIFLSWYPGEITLDYSHFHNWEATSFFPMGCGNQETARAVLDGIARGVIKIERNITHSYEYDKACEGFRKICENDRSIVGMVVDWRKS